MDLLVFGGTSFLGRAVAESALRRGHSVTTFTRGRSGAPPPGATVLYGNRAKPDDLDAALTGGRFDAVVDTSCQRAEWAQLAADRMSSISLYVFVSTLCVYRNYPPGPITDEHDELVPTDADGYGAMKVAGETLLRERLGNRLLTVRAGVIVGPEDNMGLLPWWLWRLRMGGRIPVPTSLDMEVSFLDVRDLAAWLVVAAERHYGGAVNAVGDTGVVTLGGLLGLCADVVRPDALVSPQFVPIPDGPLIALGVTLENYLLPFWVPERWARSLWQVGNDQMRAWGLESRPVAQTVADTWEWLRRLPQPPIKSGVPVPGLSPALETQLWHRIGALTAR